jgi:phthiocerol/phenolphthiocerol synthesis type-I polyketide synthase C
VLKDQVAISGTEAPDIRFASVVELVRYQAALRPDNVALIFLPDGEVEVGRITYGELDRRARTFAARLQAEGLSGQSVLLMLPSSIYYVIAFLGCLYARSIPVPAYPPTSGMHAERLAQVVADCDAKGVILTTANLQANIQSRLSQFFPDGLLCSYMAIDELSGDDALTWIEPEIAIDDLAYLQYTSGSTSQPRGVMVTHGNLLAYCESWQAAAQQDHTDIFVTWLPLFHDLGLVLGVIQPLFVGATIVMMPPVTFLQRPLRWLMAMSRYRGTASYAPNFAYELCAATLDEVQRKELDLSSWTIAVNAAEPIHADTLTRFAERFASCGYRAEAMNPSYGLAEATLTVVQRAKLEPPLICNVDVDALKKDLFIPINDDRVETRSLVSSGRSWLNIKVIAVKPESCRACEEGEIGEIWVQGPTVAKGYWKRTEETDATFNGYLENGDGPYLRTGDLGAVYQNEIYITGRIKDVVIIRGQNHYPQDIEHTVFRSHPALAIGHGAAFSVDVENEERLVIVQEVKRSQRKKFNGAEVIKEIRAAIAEQHGLKVHAVLLLAPNTVHITSSGKIQRKACRHDFLSNQFQSLYKWHEDDAVEETEYLSHDRDASMNASASRHQMIAAWLTEKIAQKKNIPVTQLAVEASFTSFGIDSMELVALSDELASWLGVAVAPMSLYDYPNIHRLARHLSGSTASPHESHSPVDIAEPIAIVGMGCNFPGAESLDAFWQLLDTGSDAITGVPAARWDADAYYEAGAAPSAGKMNTRWGGFINGIDEFDAHFFGISPREMQSMDPQQRLLLSVTWHALENAGIVPDTLAGTNAGVFVGLTHCDYRMLLSHAGAVDAYNGTGNVLCIAANRISYLLDLHGPSFAVDTACSSSFVALHQARMSLLTKECSIAIVGGVNLILSAETTVATSQAHMLSADGHCKAFDALADGYVRSEGCGVVILKRYSDALRDNNRILGLVAGSALNQDGKSNGLTAPNGIAQQAVIRRALASAGISPARVDYVEAHGTGTSLGDPIEVAALKQVYGDLSETDRPLWIGSVKTNIGHLEAASGMAGLIKVILSLQHEKIPQHLHLNKLNPLISLADSRCAIPIKAQAWPKTAELRTAGISSFGFGGANTHLIVQEAPFVDVESQSSLMEDKGEWQLLSLSAKSSSVLRDMLQSYADFLAVDDAHAASFSSICHTANVHRAHYVHRFALLARSKEEAVYLLQRYIKADNIHQITKRTLALAQPAGVAFLFTGQGSQYAGMGHGLYLAHAGFRQTLQQCDTILQPLLGQSLLSILYASEEIPVDLTQTLYAQPALFSVEYALAKMWQACGVEPHYLIGHSLGEYVAACIAGVFSLREGLTLVAHRARLMQEQAEAGAMIAVKAPAELITRLLAHFTSHDQKRIAIAAYNSPEDIVLSGDEEEVKSLAARWAAQGAMITPLQVTRGFHSPLMRSMIVEFERYAKAVSYHLPRIPIISNLTGNVADPDIASAQYWISHVLEPVRFSQGLQTLAATGCKIFIEIGPHPVLSAMGWQAVSDAFWLPSLRRDNDANYQFLLGLGEWYTHGNTVNWKQMTHDRIGMDVTLPKPLSLPCYPFQRDRFWFKPVTMNQAGLPGQGTKMLHPLLGRKLNIAAPGYYYFENVLSSAYPWFIAQHQVFGVAVLPVAALIEWSLAALEIVTKMPDSCWMMENLTFTKAMVFAEDAPLTIQTAIEKEKREKDRDAYRIRFLGRKTSEPEGEWIEHATLTSHAIDTSVVLVLEDLKKSLVEKSIDTYAHFRRLGLDYGPAFHGVKQLWSSDNQALARIEVPETSHDGDIYKLHPIVLDACFHTLIAFINADSVAADTAVLPVAINKLIMRGRLPNKIWCHVTWHGEQSPGRYLTDLELCLETGESIVSVQGLHLAKVRRNAILASVIPEQRLDSYTIDWKPYQVDPEKLKKTVVSPPGHWLVYAPDAIEADDWQKQLAQIGISAIAINAGTNFQRRRQNAITLRLHSELDIERLFATLKVEEIRTQGLLFCSAVSVSVSGIDETQVIDETYQLAQSSFLFLKHFLTAHGNESPDVIICSRGAYVVETSSEKSGVLTETGLMQSVLSGMAKSIVTEYPYLKCVQVDLDPAEPVSVRALLAGVGQLSGSGHIAWRGQYCYEARMQVQEITAMENPLVSIDANATYLITGGLGGMGLAVAEWLVEQGARSLVLLGRSIPADSAASIRQLESVGARVVAMQVDISDPVALNRVGSYISHHLPVLRGIVHSAGISDDSPMSELNWQRFSNVMAPKVLGSWNLHCFSEKMNLDFFVLFSSMVSMIGAAGSSSYAVSNVFMDSLAHYRRGQGLPAVSLNWGPWSEIGMAAKRNLLDHFAQEGVQAIETRHGLQAMARIFNAVSAQVGIGKTDWTRYKAANPRTQPYTFLADVGTEGDTAVSSNAEYLQQLADVENLGAEAANDLILKYLFHSAMRVLRLDTAHQTDLEPEFLHTKLNLLGFDSLMAVELRNRILADVAIDVPIHFFIGNSTVQEMVTLLYQQLLFKKMTATQTNIANDDIEREVFAL